MSGTLDMALDEYANTSKKGKKRNPRQPRRGRVPTTAKNVRSRNAPYERQRSRGNVEGQWSHDLYEDARPNNGQRNNVASIQRNSSNVSNSNSKLVVENLFYEVTQDELQNLFSECGPVKKVYLHYDRAGRSTGVADVTFEDPADAETALRRHNGKVLGGQQMRIKLAPTKQTQKGSSSGAEGASILDRLGGVRGGLVKQLSRGNIRSRLGRSSTNNGGSASRGRDGNVSDNRRKSSNRKPVTYDDLDADLDAYMAIDD
ncbi:6471_t:CDS:2, partial [Acaulospora morrowiae]